MPTKYELQAELRELTRGTKPLPIGKMKKEELVREITLRGRVADEREALGPAPKAKPGPLGPRKIPIIPVDTDDVVIRTPAAPARRPVSHKQAVEMAIVAASSAKKPAASRAMMMRSEEEEVSQVLPGIAKAAKARATKPQEAVEEEERTTMIRKAPRATPAASAGAGAGNADSLRSQVMDILKALAAE